jgi:hypothetical protein
MATVTGLTAARTLMIEAGLIVTVDIDSSGQIVFTKHDGTTINTAIPAASLTAQGIVELATDAEVAAGTDTVRAVTPAGLKSVTDTITSSVGTKQPLDQDLTDISGLAPAANDFLQRKSGAWTNRTISQVKTDLAYTKGDVGLGNVDNTSDVNKPVSTATTAAIAAAATPSASTTVPGKIEIATVGEAFVGADATRAVTPAGLAAMHGNGIYVPAGWGSFWRAKRDAAGSGKAIIAAVGSSSTQGLYCGNLLTDSFVSKLRTQLQTQYGNGGSGFFSSTRSLTFLGASTLTNAWNAISGNLATMSGTWLGGSNYGPAGQYMYTGDAGGYIQYAKVNGTTIRIYTMSGGGRANWQYQIDGGSIVPVTDSGTPSIQVTTITGLSAGDHTVKLIQNSAASTNFSPCGVTGENATGVIVNNFGLSGATSTIFAPATNEIYQPTTWNGGPDYPCDLLIYALGANDANGGVANDTYTANVRKFLSAVKDGTAAGGGLATGNTDILILMQHIGKYDNATPKWQDYCIRMRGIAEAYGAAVVNLWPTGRNSWNYWNSQGNWGTSGTAGGVSGTDTIHMSNAGHTAAYNAVLPLLTS